MKIEMALGNEGRISLLIRPEGESDQVLLQILNKQLDTHRLLCCGGSQNGNTGEIHALRFDQYEKREIK